MRCAITFLFLQLIITSGLAADDTIPSLVGIWEVVKLVPEGNNPIENERWYFVFFENGLLLQISEAKKSKFNVKSENNRYYVRNKQITISKSDGSESSHALEVSGNEMKLSVPFGAIWLRRAPNQSLKSGTPQSGAP